MIPSRLWFPTNFPARADWYNNFAEQFAVLAAGLGFTPAGVTAVENDNKVMQFLAGVNVELKAYEDAVRQYRIIITEAAIGKPTPMFPANTSMTLPVVIPTGLFE